MIQQRFVDLNKDSFLNNDDLMSRLFPCMLATQSLGHYSRKVICCSLLLHHVACCGPYCSTEGVTSYILPVAWTAVTSNVLH